MHILVRDEKRRYLRLDHLLHHSPRINSQHQQQRFSTIRDLACL